MKNETQCCRILFGESLKMAELFHRITEKVEVRKKFLVTIKEVANNLVNRMICANIYMYKY